MDPKPVLPYDDNDQRGRPLVLIFAPGRKEFWIVLGLLVLFVGLAAWHFWPRQSDQPRDLVDMVADEMQRTGKK